MGIGASSKKDGAEKGSAPAKGSAEGMDKVKNTFKQFDRNGDGFISQDEMNTVLNQLGSFTKEDVDSVLLMADTNKDGRIDYSEFISWVFEPGDGGGVSKRVALDYRSFLPERFEVDITKRYNLDKTALGEGGYGQVFVAKDRDQEGRVVVVKKVTKTGKDADEDEVFKREIQIMKELDHPNICKLLGTFKQGNSIFFVMEHLEGGEVFDRIIESKVISEEMTADIVSQVVGALRYAHDRGIAHRDVKPENVVFCNKDPKSSMVKVIDWGLAMTFTGSVMTESVGSMTYTAPEVMDSRNVKAYTAACDVWSLGVLCYVMLCGRPPFWGAHKVHLENARKEKYPISGGIWDSASPKAKDFIQKMLKADPQKRLTMKQAAEHPFLTQKVWPAPQAGVESSILSNMRSFSNTTTFSAMCIAAVARQLDHKKLGNIHQVFRKLDKNGDGVLSLEEIASGFGDIFGEDSEEFKSAVETFHGMDLDGSLKIDYTEFVAGGLGQHTIAQDEACWAAFKAFDIDNTGNLCVKELQQVLQSADLNKVWQQDTCKDVATGIMEKHDNDGDGRIDFNEFMAMMRSSREKNDPLGAAPKDSASPATDTKAEAARLCAYDMLLQIGSLADVK